MTPVFDLMIAGAGRLGAPLAAHFATAGYRVAAIRRSNRAVAQGVHGIRHDLAASVPHLPPARLVICCLSARRQDAAAYRAAYLDAPVNLLRGLATSPQQVILVSSTRVFSENNGGTVDETSPVGAAEFRSEALLNGERFWQGCGFPATVVRFSGIYDECSSRLIEAARTVADTPDCGLVWGNRIHRRDAIGTLAFLAGKALAGEPVADLYLASDQQPALRREVLDWLRQRMGLPGLSPLAPEQLAAATGKRCDSSRLCAAGYRFTYPDYRAGYAATLSAPG